MWELSCIVFACVAECRYEFPVLCTFLWPCSLWVDKKPLSFRWAGGFLCFAEIPAFDTCNEMTRQKVALMREWPPFSSPKLAAVCAALLLRFAEPITDRSLYTDEHDIIILCNSTSWPFRSLSKRGKWNTTPMPLFNNAADFRIVPTRLFSVHYPSIFIQDLIKLIVILVSSLSHAGSQMM